jgi:hypothetical protein
MLIFSYLTRRFLAFLAAISLLLAFIFNFIEFFEKIVRSKQVPVSVIIHFLSLNFIPTFFDLLPIAVWLAMCLLIKELMGRYEWELLQLMTFIPRKFLRFSLIMGLALSVSSLVLHERYVANLVFKAERFKQEKFKQGAPQILVNKWFELDHDRICYFSIFNPETVAGDDLLIIQFSPDFTFQKMIQACHFTINPATTSIEIPEARIFDMGVQGEYIQKELAIHSPAFFSQLKMNFEYPTLFNTAKKLSLYGKLLPSGVYNEMLGHFCSRMGYYIQLLLYPLLTICLFMVTSHPYIRWILALLAYPLLLTATITSDAAFHSGFHAFILLMPYLLVLLFVLWCWGMGSKIKKTP